MNWRIAPETNLTEWYWLTVHSMETARTAAFNSSYFVLLVGAMSAAMAVRSGAQVMVPLADAAIYGGLVLLMRRMSRVAAVSALALYVLDHVYEIYARGLTLGIFVTAFVAVGIASGVRGTIAYHRYKGQPEPPEASRDDNAAHVLGSDIMGAPKRR